MAGPRFLERPSADLSEADPSVVLPYGLTASAVVTAVNDIYAYLHAINRASIDHGYARLEDLMQPAGFSGLMSGLAVGAMAHGTEREGAAPGLRANLLLNGRPDLIPRGIYPGDRIHRGDEGIEVKASRFRTASSWQGHNIEAGRLMVVHFLCDVVSVPIYDRAPTTVERVCVAQLEESDWTFSGRSETSRRTITASVNQSGYAKLIAGRVYQRGHQLSLIAPPASG